MVVGYGHGAYGHTTYGIVRRPGPARNTPVVIDGGPAAGLVANGDPATGIAISAGPVAGLVAPVERIAAVAIEEGPAAGLVVHAGITAELTVVE